MDELDGNPLYRAYLTKFRREYELACKRSYVIAIPTSESLDELPIDQSLATSHILMPSKLLRMHYTSMQAGASEDIEIDGKRLICRLDKQQRNQVLEVNILAEEVCYNANNEEYRTIIIDRPLLIQPARQFFGGLLSPSSASQASARRLKAPRSLRDHDECSKYLESLSQRVTTELELEVRHFQMNCVIQAQQVDDVANRILNLADGYVAKYEEELGASTLSDGLRRSIRVSVETYSVHLLHGRLMASINRCYERDDQIVARNFSTIRRSRTTVCQLGAQSDFSDFAPTSELIAELQSLPQLQSPLAAVSCIVRVMGHITECLNASVRFKQLIGADGQRVKTMICSDDLIASLILSIAQARVENLYSIAKYLEAFGWSSVGRDQAAYDAATFQLVIQYVYNQSSNETPNGEPIRSDTKVKDPAEGRNRATTNNESLSQMNTRRASFLDMLESQANHSSSPLSVGSVDWELVYKDYFINM